MTGRIVRIAGSVVDVAFEGGALPRINEALTAELSGGRRVMEVAQHIGGGLVRCVLLSGGEGLYRGLEVVATGDGIRVPVGEAVIGRMMNVVGEPIDGGRPIDASAERWSIHRKAPYFEDQNP